MDFRVWSLRLEIKSLGFGLKSWGYGYELQIWCMDLKVQGFRLEIRGLRFGFKSLEGLWVQDLILRFEIRVNVNGQGLEI